MSFRDIISEFLDTSSVSFYMIHLERAVERIPVIEALESMLGISLIRYPGADGKQLVAEGHPTACISGKGNRRGAGDVGCTVSHIRVCRDALEKGYSYAVIFEDDCQIIATLQDMQSVLQTAKRDFTNWDLFILDGSLYNSVHISNTISRVKQFNQTHAVILNQKFMKALVALYDEYYAKNTTFAIDGIYSNVLTTTSCVGIGITHKHRLFCQKPMYSYILNRSRNH